jgi:hypothetical protein
LFWLLKYFIPGLVEHFENWIRKFCELIAVDSLVYHLAAFKNVIAPQ